MKKISIFMLGLLAGFLIFKALPVFTEKYPLRIPLYPIWTELQIETIQIGPVVNPHDFDKENQVGQVVVFRNDISNLPDKSVLVHDDINRDPKTGNFVGSATFAVGVEKIEKRLDLVIDIGNFKFEKKPILTILRSSKMVEAQVEYHGVSEHGLVPFSPKVSLLDK